MKMKRVIFAILAVCILSGCGNSTNSQQSSEELTQDITSETGGVETLPVAIEETEENAIITYLPRDNSETIARIEEIELVDLEEKPTSIPLQEINTIALCYNYSPEYNICQGVYLIGKNVINSVEIPHSQDESITDESIPEKAASEEVYEAESAVDTKVVADLDSEELSDIMENVDTGSDYKFKYVIYSNNLKNGKEPIYNQELYGMSDLLCMSKDNAFMEYHAVFKNLNDKNLATEEYGKLDKISKTYPCDKEIYDNLIVVLSQLLNNPNKLPELKQKYGVGVVEEEDVEEDAEEDIVDETNVIEEDTSKSTEEEDLNGSDEVVTQEKIKESSEVQEVINHSSTEIPFLDKSTLPPVVDIALLINGEVIEYEEYKLKVTREPDEVRDNKYLPIIGTILYNMPGRYIEEEKEQKEREESKRREREREFSDNYSSAFVYN